MSRVLCRGLIVPNMLPEPIHTRLILNENLNWLFSLELDGLARWYFSSKVIDHLALGFWVLSSIQAQVVIVLNEVPVKFDSIVNSFI